ncbi:hypothetical protein ACGFT2_22205 [Streptomyces sp. NPDC048514]|uniref:hypothetical protein n=1 Tax=Streptomyces sp. NPDC048514 TaxID=3365564 RepID=UPI003720DF29
MALPDIHEECGRVLDGSRTRRWEERTSGRAMPGMPLNTGAVEARAAITRVLASWSGVVAEQRRTATPRREVRALAGFLLRHLDWLRGHEAVVDLAEEVAGLMRAAARVVDAPPKRGMSVGGCTVAGCGGVLVAWVARDPGKPPEVVCTETPGHRRALHEWLTPGAEPADADGDAPRPAAATTPLWLSATDIARLWQAPRGTVYRLASEKGWRRRSRSGRTLYHVGDARQSLAERGRRAAP